MNEVKELSVEEWWTLFRDNTVFKPENMLIMRRFMDMGGAATCSQLANRYGQTWAYYNSKCSKLAKRIADKMQISLERRDDGSEIRWPALFTGSNVSGNENIDGSFLWTLKPNLKAALEQVDLSQFEPLYETKTNFEDKNMDELIGYCNFLKANHNIILHGAPGTGKTYLAKEIAKEMGCTENEIGFVQFHQSYDYTDFVEGLRPAKGEDEKADGFERKDGVFKSFCKRALVEVSADADASFENSWQILLNKVREDVSKDSLTEIGSREYSLSKVNSLKYTSVDTPSGYSSTITKQNVFDAYCGKMSRPSGGYQKDIDDVVAYMRQNCGLADYKKKDGSEKKCFVFIIDEINRGEMSKIFGELFFSIDPGYRGEKGRIDTQYQNLVDEDDAFADGFYVPENVYIIGTMNDIDRSVESMDFAMRRRFAFKEVKAVDRIAMLDDLKYGKKDDAVKRMNALNAAVEKVEGLSSAYDIGPAYFLKLDNYGGDFNQLWEYHIEGALREYLRGMEDAEETLATLHKAYNLENASA